MANSAIQKDEFANDSFIDKAATLPTVTVLNHETRCGFFIPLQVMAKIDWIHFDENKLTEHTYRNKEKDLGVLITNPRMLCIAKSDLYQFDADESLKQKTKVIVGLYDAARKGVANIKTERLYAVFFLDADNNFLHKLPLKYAARGANGATFEAHRKAFRAELEVCHALANGIPASPKNDRFHSLGVFCFSTSADLVGEGKNSAWVCKVDSHEKPTIDNWRNYFIGFTESKDYVWTALEPEATVEPKQLSAAQNNTPPPIAHRSGDHWSEDPDDILY